MLTEQSIGELTYSRPKQSQTVPSTLELRQEFNRVSSTETRIDIFVNPDDSATRKVDTITVDSLGNSGDVIGITIDNGQVLPYVHIQQSGDTAEDVASHLARLINASPTVTATVSGTTITVSSAIAGEDYTVADITDGTNGGSISVTNDTPASGGNTEAKVAEQVISLGTGVHKPLELPSLKVETVLRGFKVNGDSVSIFTKEGRSFAEGNSTFYHGQSLDTVQTEAGISRSN